MIAIRNLSKRYGNVIALDEVTFTVEPGMITGFLGPNGAGKSTTMRIILGLDRATSGEALVQDRAYNTFAEPMRAVGALLDPGAIHAGRSGRNHLLVAAQTNGIPRGRVDEIIELVGLGSAAKRRIKGYSLGMRQRLGIAAALLGDPKVLLFDEPMNGLDLDGVLWIRKLFRQLADEGRSLLVSSHLMTEMQQTADRLVVIGQGKVIADATTDEILDGLGNRRVSVGTPRAEELLGHLLGHGLSARKVAEHDLEVDEATEREVGALAHDINVPLHHLSEHRHSLEEAYLALTAGTVEYHGSTHDGGPRESTKVTA